VDDVDKWLYNFARVAMESTDQLLVESMEPKPLVLLPWEPHKKKLAWRKAGFTKQEDHVIYDATGRTHKYYCSRTAINYNYMCCRSKPIKWKLLQAFS
jgi:hypothetical protein